MCARHMSFPQPSSIGAPAIMEMEASLLGQADHPA